MSASPNTGSWLTMTPHGKPQRLAAAASSGDAEQVMASAGRASAPGLAGSSFPVPVQTGLSAAPPGPAPQTRQSPPDQAQGRRRCKWRRLKVTNSGIFPQLPADSGVRLKPRARPPASPRPGK